MNWTVLPLYQWQVAHTKLLDSDLLELILLRGQLPAVRETAIFPALCSWLRHPDQASQPSALLFARLLQCPLGEVADRMMWSALGAKVKKTAGQLHSAGMMIEAGSIVLMSQDFHPGLQTVNGSIDLLCHFFH